MLSTSAKTFFSKLLIANESKRISVLLSDSIQAGGYVVCRHTEESATILKSLRCGNIGEDVLLERSVKRL